MGRRLASDSPALLTGALAAKLHLGSRRLDLVGFRVSDWGICPGCRCLLPPLGALLKLLRNVEAGRVHSMFPL